MQTGGASRKGPINNFFSNKKNWNHQRSTYTMDVCTPVFIALNISKSKSLVQYGQNGNEFVVIFVEQSKQMEKQLFSFLLSLLVCKCSNLNYLPLLFLFIKYLLVSLFMVQFFFHSQLSAIMRWPRSISVTIFFSKMFRKKIVRLYYNARLISFVWSNLVRFFFSSQSFFA